MDFYAVLPSNASPDVYPNNKTNNFKVQLCERMDLHGQWQVALLEIHYPNTLSHVLKGENWVEVLTPLRTVVDASDIKINVNSPVLTKTTKHSIKTGIYKNGRELINELQLRLEKMSISPETQKRSTILKETPEGVVQFNPFRAHLDSSYKVAPALALQLGLPHAGPYRADSELFGIRPIDLSLGIPSQMYVYLNILQDQIVGHTRAPLLRTIPTVIDAKFGSMTTYRCEHPVYYDLNTKSFDNIEVNIRTDTGEFLPFNHGTLTLLVHFRQRA